MDRHNEEVDNESGSASEDGIDSGRSSSDIEGHNQLTNPVDYMDEEDLIYKSYKFNCIKLSECPLLGRPCDDGSNGIFGCTMVNYRDKLWIYGGRDHWLNLHGSVIVYDLRRDNWKFSCSGSAPPARRGHSAVVFNESMFVYGGSANSTDSFGDMWEFNLEREEWTPWLNGDEDDSPDKMTSRMDHGCSLYQGKMTVFGGMFKDGCDPIYVRDMWSIDLTTRPTDDGPKPKFEQLRYFGQCPTMCHNSSTTAGDFIYAWEWHDLTLLRFSYLTKTWTRLFNDEFISGQTLHFKHPFIVCVDGAQGENRTTQIKVWDTTSEEEPSLRRFWMCDLSPPLLRGGVAYTSRTQHGAALGNDCLQAKEDGIFCLYVYGGIATDRDAKRLNDLWLVRFWEEDVHGGELIPHPV